MAGSYAHQIGKTASVGQFQVISLLLAVVHWCGVHFRLLACAVVHAAAFAVNGALLASQWQWQHRSQTVHLHLTIDAEHEAG